MNIAASPGAHICASAQIYPDSKPAEVPPRPAWAGADPRVMKIIHHTIPAWMGKEKDSDEGNKSIKERY